MSIVHPFKPIYDSNSKILILGSFPSVKSRENSFYYGHCQNRFWKLLAKIFETQIPVTIQEKKNFLLKNSIALWDVIKSCDIKGSSDSSITNVEINDIDSFVQQTNIHQVFFNGNTAYKLYLKYSIYKKYNQVLPSTSPANATFTLDKLYDVWNQQIKAYLSHK